MCESLSILAQICLLCRDLEVVSRQSFVFLLQVCSRLSRLEDLVLLFCFSRDGVFLLRHSSSFQHENSIATEFTLSRQYFMHSSDSYVTTLIIMSQHSFNAASTSWCRYPSSYVATISLFRLCCNTVLYYLYFYRDPKSLSW